MPGARRERGLTSKPGRGAPSEPAWEVLAVSSSPSSPLRCWKTGQTDRQHGRDMIRLGESHSTTRGDPAQSCPQTPHLSPFSEEWCFLCTYLLNRDAKEHTARRAQRPFLVEGRAGQSRLGCLRVLFKPCMPRGHG